MIEVTPPPARRQGLKLALPAGFTAVSQQHGQLCYAMGPVLAEVTWHEGSAGFAVTLRNQGQELAKLPGVRLSVPEATGSWVAGAAGWFWLEDGAWVMASGWCRLAGSEALVFGPELELPAGGSVWSRWRYFPWEQQPALPGWVPEKRYRPLGEPVLVPDLDVALAGTGLSIEPTDAGGTVFGPVGLHELTVHTPMGPVSLEIGWHPSMRELLAEASSRVEAADLRAWLLVGMLVAPDQGPASSASLGWPNQLGDLAVVDQLDLLLGECFEAPSLFGALAGLVAARRTELPVGAEAWECAQRAAAEIPGWQGAFLAVVAQLCGHGQLDGAWRAESSAADWIWELGEERAGARISARLGGGMPLTCPKYTAEDLAQAQLWLAGRADSRLHLDLEPVLECAQQRLLAQLGAAADPQQLAWVLLGTVVAGLGG